MYPPEDAEKRLLRLLALKRHELPPPGFFDQLPSRILVSLRAGSEISELSWWDRVWQTVVQQPMVGLSYATLGIGAVLFGISVLETALDVREVKDRTNAPLQGALLHGPTGNLVVGPPSHLNGTIIYRVAEPSGSMVWVQPEPNVSTLSPFSKVDGFEVVPVNYPANR